MLTRWRHTYHQISLHQMAPLVAHLPSDNTAPGCGLPHSYRSSALFCLSRALHFPVNIQISILIKLNKAYITSLRNFTKILQQPIPIVEAGGQTSGWPVNKLITETCNCIVCEPKFIHDRQI